MYSISISYVIFNVVRIMYYLMYSCSHLMNKCVVSVLFVHIILYELLDSGQWPVASRLVIQAGNVWREALDNRMTTSWVKQ